MTAPARVLWVDAANGAAGDMLLAALLDAGADLAAVSAGLARLRVEPIELRLTGVRRHGLRAAHLAVHAPESPVHRGLADVLAVVDAAGLPDAVRKFAGATFTRLATAEARVHGCSVDEVHFHEVGALDAIADVVGCALALHDLGLLDAPVRVVSPVAVGSGSVRAAHGRLPVPVPAVVELLAGAGAPVAAHPAAFELCTPTGAALLVTLATGWGPVPAMTPRGSGVGAGSADPESHANVLRIVVGDAAATPRVPRPASGAAGPVADAEAHAHAHDWGADGWLADADADDWLAAELYQVETSVDDLDPRIWPDLLESLRAAGAADAWCVPALMRKGRPGQVLSVLVDADRVDLVCRLLFEQTTTLGVRVGPVQRRSLRRGTVEVAVGDHRLPVKYGTLGGAVVTVQPEYDEARAIARATGRPIAEILDAANRKAHAALSVKRPSG